MLRKSFKSLKNIFKGLVSQLILQKIAHEFNSIKNILTHQKSLGLTIYCQQPFLLWNYQLSIDLALTLLLGPAAIIISEFKVLLRKNIMKSRSFIDNIWSRFRCESQYHIEEIYNQTFYLKHFQSILLEFDTDKALEESHFIRFF